MRRAAGAALVAVVVALATLGLGGGAHAHVRATTVYATVTSVDGDVDVVLSVEYDLLTTAAGLGDAARTSVDEVEQAVRCDRSADERGGRRRTVPSTHRSTTPSLPPSPSLHRWLS